MSSGPRCGRPPVPIVNESPLTESPKALFLSILLKCHFSQNKMPFVFAMFCLMKKIGNYLETPKRISGELHKPVETLPDAKGARRFARAWAQKQPVEGIGTEAIAPKPSHQLTQPSWRGENRMNLFFLFFKRHLLLRFGVFRCHEKDLENSKCFG